MPPVSSQFVFEKHVSLSRIDFTYMSLISNISIVLYQQNSWNKINYYKYWGVYVHLEKTVTNTKVRGMIKNKASFVQWAWTSWNSFKFSFQHVYMEMSSEKARKNSNVERRWGTRIAKSN